jgi:hypothetical protein
LTSRNTTSQVPKVDITHFHHSSCQFGQVQRCFPSSWSVPLPAIHCNTTGHIALQPILSVSRSLLRRNHGVTCTTLAAGPLALASCHPPSRWRATPLIMLLLVQCPKTAQPRFDRCWGGCWGVLCRAHHCRIEDCTHFLSRFCQCGKSGIARLVPVVVELTLEVQC